MLNQQQNLMLELLALHLDKLAQRRAAGENTESADVVKALCLAVDHSAAIQMGKQRNELNEKARAAEVEIKNIILKRESRSELIASAKRCYSLDSNQRLSLDQAESDVHNSHREERDARARHQKLREQYEKTDASRNAILAQLEQEQEQPA